MAEGYVTLTIGSSNYSVKLDPDRPIVIRKKPDSGEIQKTIASARRVDQIDAPRSIITHSGIGMSRIVESPVQSGAGYTDPQNRSYEQKNIMAWWPGMFCLGPLARTVTDVTGTRQTIGFFQWRSALFAFADVIGSTTTESVQIWDNTNFTDATCTADYNTAAGSNVGFRCVGMAEQDGRVYALNTIFNAPAARYQLIYATNNTTWTVPDHVNAADCPGPDTTYVCKGLISIAGVLYTATLNSTNQILLRQNAAGNNGVTWTTTATSKESVSAITGLIATLDYAGVMRPLVLTPEGGYLWNGTLFYQAIDHIHKWGQNETNTGKSPTVWEVESVEGGYLTYPNGRDLKLLRWGDNDTYVPNTISPTFNTQGLPMFRDGVITALCAVHNYLFAAIGGDSSSTTGGIYCRPSSYLHPQGWFGPFYDIGTANRQVRAMFVSSYSDGVERLFIAVDNGSANDTDLLYFDNILSDPRTVSDYKHTAATGTMIFPKDDLFLTEVQKTYRYAQFLGTNIDSTDKVDDVFGSFDAAPLDSSGSWGTTWGEGTSNGVTVNAPGTPSGTGTAARALQLRVDLIGGSNDSPYIEGVNIGMKTLWPVKYIYEFPLLFEPQGTVQPWDKLLADLEAIVAATTDASVTFGEETTAITMEPQRYGDGPIVYQYETEQIGTVNSNIKEIKGVTLVMVGV